MKLRICKTAKGSKAYSFGDRGRFDATLNKDNGHPTLSILSNLIPTQFPGREMKLRASYTM